MISDLKSYGWKPFVGLLMVICPALAEAAGYRTESLGIRGKSMTMYVYDPAPGAVRRPFQVVIASGDLGWVGISVDIAERMQSVGYRVIGFNSRAYLSSFTGKDVQLQPRDIPGDFATVLDWAAGDGSKAANEFILIGVSEGAGLAVLGMGQGNACARCRGIIALGLPSKTTLGWRWTDFTMWITKKDPNEPLADTGAFLRNVKVPIAMIHSTHDEWDSIESARAMYALLQGPKQFWAVESANHRFSDKTAEVLSRVETLLKWMENPSQGALQPSMSPSEASQVHRP